MLANRWDPEAVRGNQKLPFGKLGSICNNILKLLNTLDDPLKEMSLCEKHSLAKLKMFFHEAIG